MPSPRSKDRAKASGIIALTEQASAWGVAFHAYAGSALAARVGTLGYLGARTHR